MAITTCLATPYAYAADAPARLQTFFKETQTLRADFTQTVQDGRMRVKESAEGTVVLQRPGKFRWDYRKPYQQVIVSDGRKVWVYDQDLEQVTVKDLHDAMGATPAHLLSDGAALNRDFVISDAGHHDDLDWVELTPHEKDAGFERVRLGFTARDLQRMELTDSLGQTTRLQFSHMERNPGLPAKLFEFTPPPGVDVVGE